MGFRYSDLGRKVSTDPKAASEELSQLMLQVANNQVELARSLGVDRSTLGRWFDRLRDKGFPVGGRGDARRGRKSEAETAAAEAKAKKAECAAAGYRRRGRVRRAAAA